MTKEELDNICLTYIPYEYNELCSQSKKDELRKYLNGVEGLTKTLDKNDEPNGLGDLKGIGGYSVLIGKTIADVFECNYDTWSKSKYTIYCFTDNTFAIRYKHNMLCDDNDIPLGISSSEITTYLNIPYSDMVIYRGGVGNSFNKEECVKILPFGRWLIENTNADIIGFYNKCVEDMKNDKERMKEYEHKRDLEQYNKLKEKLGF